MNKDIYDSPYTERRKNIFYESSREVLSNLPECNTMEEIEEKNELAMYEFFKVKQETFNTYLKRKFEVDGIFVFLNICFKKNFSISLPHMICVAFRNETNYAELFHLFLHSYNPILKTHIGVFPNLHDKFLYTFSLINANFDLEKCNSGFHYSTDKYQFVIKTSVQFDIILAYHEISKGESS